MRNVCCKEIHWLFPRVSGTVSRTVLRFVAIARTALTDLGSDPACATHHNLVLVASIDSDLLDNIVILAALGSAMWWPLRLLLRSLPAVRIIIEINGVVIYNSTDVDSCSSRHFARSRSRQSSSLKLLAVFRLPTSWQCTSASQTRTSRFDKIGTSCVALHILEHLLRRTASDSKTLCTHRCNGLVHPTSHHALTPWRYEYFSSLMLDNLMTTSLFTLCSCLFVIPCTTHFQPFHFSWSADFLTSFHFLRLSPHLYVLLEPLLF